MREKLREILTNEDKVIIWDVDGVLAAYEYGERNHNACLDLEWDEYLKEHDVYETARPLATLQRWMAEHASSKRMFVCTTASNMEEFKRKAKKIIVYKYKRKTGYHKTDPQYVFSGIRGAICYCSR